MAYAVEIERGIPIPAPKYGKSSKGQCKYPFATMEIGDSFLVGRALSTFGPYIRVWVQRNNSDRRFTCRTEGSKSTRVWRIA